MTVIPAKRTPSPITSTSTSHNDRARDVGTVSKPAARRVESSRPAPRGHNGAGAVKKPRTFNRVLVNFFDAIFEEENYEEALLSFEGMVAHHQIPHPSHIRQLLALSLNTSSSIGNSTSARTLPSIVTPTPDPIPLTEHKLRLEALHILERIARSNGAQAILRAIPSHAPRDPLLLPLYDDYLPIQSGDEEGVELFAEEPEEDDTELTLAGKRMSQRTTCEDLWALLGGSADRVPRSRDTNRPLTEGGWETLSMFVGAWEDERRMKLNVEGEMKEIGYAPSLLQTFTSNSIDLREISARALDVVFWPFGERSSAHNDDADVEDAPAEQRKDFEPLIREMELSEKRHVAARLLGLISNGAVVGRLTHIAWINDIVGRMRELRSANLASFLELLTTTSHPDFCARLLCRFIELVSHPLNTAFTTLSQGSPPSTTSVMPPSPRRRPMSLQSSSIISDPSTSTSAIGPDSSLIILPDGPSSSSTLPPLSTSSDVMSQSSGPKPVHPTTPIPYFSPRPNKILILPLLRSALPLEFPPTEKDEIEVGTKRRPNSTRHGVGPSKKGSMKREALDKLDLVKRYLVEVVLDDEAEGMEECLAVIQELEKGLRERIGEV